MPKKFKDLVEVLNDRQTRKFILEEIQLAYETKVGKHEDLTKEIPKVIANDTRLTRTPWESLQDKGILQLPDIAYEFIRIKNKSSELSASERKIIDSLVRIAIIRTIKHYKLTK
jgi:hypothetical protein